MAIFVFSYFEALVPFIASGSYSSERLSLKQDNIHKSTKENKNRAIYYFPSFLHLILLSFLLYYISLSLSFSLNIKLPSFHPIGGRFLTSHQSVKTFNLLGVWSGNLPHIPKFSLTYVNNGVDKPSIHYTVIKKLNISSSGICDLTLPFLVFKFLSPSPQIDPS